MERGARGMARTCKQLTETNPKVESGATHPPGVSSLQPSRFNRRGTGKSSVEPAEEINNREEARKLSVQAMKKLQIAQQTVQTNLDGGESKPGEVGKTQEPKKQSSKVTGE
jgi:hypothetical protein